MAVAGVGNTEQKTHFNSLFLKIHLIQTHQRKLELPVIVMYRADNALIQYLKSLGAVLRQHWEAMTELV